MFFVNRIPYNLELLPLLFMLVCVCVCVVYKSKYTGGICRRNACRTAAAIYFLGLLTEVVSLTWANLT